MNTDEILKALEEEIERVEHQMESCRGSNTYENRKKWKKYLKSLYDIAAEIQLLGIPDDRDI